MRGEFYHHQLPEFLAIQLKVDLTLPVTGWDTSSPAFTRFGYYPQAGADDTLSFMAHFTAAIDNTTDAAFYTLYKQTLGQGLSLP
jgi:hypothetical protein